MKKILFILGFLVSFYSSFSQTFLTPRSSPTTTVQDSRLRGLLNFYYPHTHGLTLNGGLDTLGMVLYEDSSSHVWYRDTVLGGGHKWSMLLKVGDAVSGVSSFNTRTGAITLSSGDVVTALGFTPVNPNGTSFQYIAGDGSKVTFPTIPAQINITDAGLFTHSGTYPNYIFTGGTPTQQQVFTQGATLTQNDFWITGANVLGMTGTAAFGLPTGSTSQRPSSPGTGYFRYNTDSAATETYNGSQWVKTGTGTGVTGVTSFNTRTGAVTLTSGDVTTALTFTPYNSSNPSGYISNISGLVTAGANITITGSGTSGSPYVIVGTSSGSVFNQDSIKHRFVDTGSTARNLYNLSWDSVNKKWILVAPGTGGGGTGTVTNFSFTNANGFSGTVTNASTIPSLTVGTSVTGLLFGNGTALGAATVSAPLTYSAGTLGIQVANTSQNGYLSSTDWNTFNGKQGALTLTTTGSSGAATLVGSTLNIPQYQGALTLTTTGSSGAATLTGSTLNIPQYSGGTTPGGSNTQIQFNNSGAFGGSANLTWNGTTLATTALSASTTVNFTGLTNTTGGATFKVLVQDTSNGKLWNIPYYPFDSTGYAAGNTIASFNGTKVILTAASGLQTFQQTLTTGSTLTTNNTVNQGTHNFIWTGGGLHQFDSTRYTQGYINPVLVADSLSAFGNSIGLGANATLIPDSGFNGRLARNYQKVLYNHSISGIKIYDIIGINMATINPGHHSFTSFEGGINDLRSFSSSNVFNAINNCFNAAIINQYLSSYVSGSDASITRTGTWTINYPINNAGFGKTATAAYTNNHIGDHADWTSPISTSVALQVSGQVGVGATITVVIDGVTVDNIVTANQVETGSYIPMARVYTGLSNATHSVTLTYSGGSGLFILDYLGVVTATPTMPFVAFDVPYLFFTSGTGAGNDTKIRTDTVNNRIAATVAFYRAKGWPVYHAPVNNYYTATLVVDLSSDSVHPNNTGHARIYQSALATINASSFTGGTLVYSNDGHFYGQSLTGLNQLAYFSEVNLQAALTNGSAMLTNMFINGNGFSASFSNFTTMSFDSILIIKNTGNPSTAIVNVHGQFAAYGASAAIQVLSRNGDTTKGFQFVTGGGAISVSDLFNGGRNIIQIDSGYRARFIHDANSITVNSSPVMSTVYIDGNRNGRAGYTSFKIDSGVLVTTPEKYAIENNGLHFYWTDRTGTRFQLDQQSGGSGVTTVGSFSGSSIANGASISTTTITFGPADATNPGMIKNTGSQTLGATLTMPAPFFTSLSSSGANDSVLTVDPSTGQVHRRAGNQSLFFANGLTAATADSVYLGGSLNHNTTLGTAGFNFSITGLPNKSTALSTDSVLIGDVAGKLWKLPVPSATTPTLQQVLTAGSVLTSTSGITLGNNNLTIGGFSGSGQVFINNPLQLAFAAVNTDADYTVGPENGVILQATITASRNLVLPTNSGGSQAGRIFYVDNSNPTNFLWTISAAGGASVKDASGNTITTLQKGINYVFSGGSGSVWRLISTSRLGGPISNDLTGQTTAATVTSYAVPGSGSFNTFSVGGYLTVTAVSLDVIQLQVAYTDETNTSRTQSFFVQGATTGISATGANGYSPINIRVKQGTTITVSTVLTTGTGSITYDVGASIIQIY